MREPDEYSLGFKHGYDAGYSEAVRRLQCIAAGIDPGPKVDRLDGPCLPSQTNGSDPASGQGQPSPEIEETK